MKKILLFVIFCAALIFGTENISAQRGRAQADTLEVRLASFLPQQSPWGRTLDRLAVEWSRITNGQVRLRVLHGGTEGGEENMLRSMSGNNIQAAVLTSFGLSAINPAVMTISTPFLIRSDAELSAVLAEVQGDLEALVNGGDFFVLSWSKAGFVNIFSREPVFTPDDLRRMRVGSQPEAVQMNASFRRMGFDIIESGTFELGSRLSAGTITAAYQNPAAAAAFQLHTITRNMLQTNIAPVLGGIVINQVTWRRIGTLDPRYQRELAAATKRISNEFDSTFSKTVEDAVVSMTRAGLTVNSPSSSQEQLWINEIDRAIPSLLGSVFDRDLYQKINAALARHRAGN